MGRMSIAIFIFFFGALRTFCTVTSSTVVYDKYVKDLADAVRPYKEHIQGQWTRQESPPTVAAEDLTSGSLLTCGLCTSVLPILRTLANTLPRSTAKSVVVAVCNQLDLAPEAKREEICLKIVDSYAESMLYIIRNTEGTQLCGFIFPDCEHTVPGLPSWKIDLPGNKPDDQEIDDMRGTVPANTTYTKVIQFTDIHMDLYYKEGGNANCGDGVPICCRAEDGPPVNENVKAGKYGHWNCALPLVTVQEMFKHAANNHSDARYVFMTGDYLHSGIWLYSKEENKEHISKVFESLKDVYDKVGKNQTKIYPLSGNHEAHVVNLYAPPELWGELDGAFDLKWMYEAVLEHALDRDKDLLPQAEIDRFLKHGYYVALPEPGLRLLAINTNFGYVQNFWIGYSPIDNQLQWIADELAEAEVKGDKVIIIGHEEPGSSWKPWSSRFNEIVNRYEGIIAGKFYGHSHRSQYRIGFRKDSLTPTTTSIITGSALTDKMNPAYGVFYFDGERGRNSTWKFMRHEQITLRLLNSNKAGRPIFETLVDSSKDFGMSDLTPASVFDFTKRLTCDQYLMDKYLEFYYKGNDSINYKRCLITDSCMEEHLCTLVGSNPDDPAPCAYMKTMLKTNDCNFAGNLRINEFYIVLLAFLGIFMLR